MFLLILENNLEVIKNLILKQIGPSYSQKFNCSDNPGQNILNKVHNSSKTGQDQKSLTSTFACCLTAIANFYFLEGRLTQSKIERFLLFPTSLSFSVSIR